MTAKPDAFLSYTRFDDGDGEISAFRERLSRTVRQVSGEAFVIFQDVDDETGIALGERWKDKLDEMLDQARFFIPILTPSFFRSEPCRQELRTFLDLEQKVGRRDLVLPIYWITCPVLEEGDFKARDELAQELDERQRWDWRELIFEDLRSAMCRRELHALSTQISRARWSVSQNAKEKRSVVEVEVPEGVKLRVKRTPTMMKTIPASNKLPTAEVLWTPGGVFRDIDEPWCPEMVKIPAGTFLMGSPEDEKGRSKSEGPQHEVTIGHDFALGRRPVTFEEYDRFCESTGRTKPKDYNWGRGRRPVINVSHGDAEVYCVWLSELTNVVYRLPTEAEWEYACRACDQSAYASLGNEISKDQANFGSTIGKTTKVGTFPTNDWNLYDMQGNVWEWCADSPRIYRPEPVTDPNGTGSACVLRGGSWVSLAQNLRSACRLENAPDFRVSYFGFRCARDGGAANEQSRAKKLKRSVWTIDTGRD